MTAPNMRTGRRTSYPTSPVVTTTSRSTARSKLRQRIFRRSFTERIPQGINPRILLLDLTIVKTAEFGGQIVEYHKATYEHPTSGHQYDEVDILFDGEIIERI